MNKNTIIHNMCMKFRHDYATTITEDEKLYSLVSGMTENEQFNLRNQMTDVFNMLIEDGLICQCNS
jgi:hypothetical protein